MSSNRPASPRKEPFAAAPAARSRGESAVLCFGVALAGASVMVLELLGTRVLAPVFGNSLYVWTALISVTLASLTLGYPLGGWVADRFPAGKVFFTTLGLAGLAVLLTLVIRAPVLKWTSDWGPRAGTLGAGVLLFMLPLVLLGMVGPFASRLFVRDMQRVGLTVGTISAISAAGSIVGSILTGFVLIPSVGIRNILLTVGVALIVIAVVGLLITRGTGLPAGVVAAALAMGYSMTLVDRAPALPSIMQVDLEGSSAYGDVKVISVPLEKDGKPVPAKIMFLGQVVQTMDTPDAAFPTVFDCANVVPAMRPGAKRVLLIGLGGGTKAQLLNKHGIGVDAVEIDPLVIQAARDHFGLVDGPHCRIIEADGRPFINQCRDTYDVVYLDAFGGGVAPAHLYSVEAFAAVRRCLAPDGLLVINTLRPMIPPPDRVLPDILKTLAADGLFRERRVFVWSAQSGGDIMNHLICASNGSLDFAQPWDRFLPPHLAARMIERLAPTVIDDSIGVVITDDLNPLDVLQLRHNDLLRAETLHGDFSVLFDPRRH